MSGYCDSCWTPKLYGKEKCRSCSNQPGLTNQLLWNPVTCKFGYTDCINDPGYIFVNYPDWYKELYGDIGYEEAAKLPRHSCAECTEQNCLYDDEDK